MESVKDQKQIDLKEILSTIWVYKNYILAITLSVGILTFFISLQFPDRYKSEVVLSESSGTMNQSNSNLGQVSSIALLAGIDLSSSSQRVDMAIEMMRSFGFFKTFAEKHNILPSLLAVDYWDKTQKEIVFDKNIYNPESNSWNNSKFAKNGVPYFQSAHKEFFKITKISIDNQTNFVRISVSHESPELADYWVKALVKEINEVFKKDDIQKAENSIAYLNEQIGKTNFIEVRNTLNNIIEDQFKLIMTANSSEEYLFKELSPSFVAEKKTSPNRPLIFLASSFITLLLSSLFFIFLRFSLQEKI